jgi:prepilin-type processing-associated H-X9-DG protein
MGDSGYSQISWMAADETIEEPFENPQRVNSFYLPGLELNRNRTDLVNNEDAIKGRHPNQQVNLIFTDGHLKTCSAEFLRCGQTSFDPDELPQLWFP